MRAYELLYISDPRVSEEETAALRERINNQITSAGGEIVQEDDWGVRRLAYPIEKMDDGHYILLRFKSAPDFVKPLDRQLRLLQSVMRFMIVKKEE